MKKYMLLLLLACNAYTIWSQNDETRTSEYKVGEFIVKTNTFKSTYCPGGSEENAGYCETFSSQWPIFESDNELLAENINNQLSEAIDSLYLLKYPNAYMVNNWAPKSGGALNEEISFEVHNKIKPILCVEMHHTTNWLMCRDMEVFCYYFSNKYGNRLTINDLIAPEKQAVLFGLVKSKFKKQTNDELFQFDDVSEDFKRFGNPLLTEKGMEFIFVPHAGYNSELTAIFSWAEIKPFINKKGPLAYMLY
jgi:hypothetical protein